MKFCGFYDGLEVYRLFFSGLLRQGIKDALNDKDASSVFRSDNRQEEVWGLFLKLFA